MTVQMKNDELGRVCEELVAQISGLYDGFADGDSKEAESSRLQVYWQIGRAICAVEKKNRVDDSDASKVMGRLGTALSKKYGKALCRSNMYHMKRFYGEYPRLKKDGGLSWSHYRTLLAVKDVDVRKELEERVVNEGLSQRALMRVVREVTGFQKTPSSLLYGKLVVQKRPLNVYKVVKDGAGQTVLDVGFLTRTPLVAGELSSPVVGSYVTPSEAGAQLELVGDEKKSRFAYSARLVRVVDGDTLILEMALHPRVSVHKRFRLRGINAAEAGTTLGDKATRFVERRLTPERKLVVHTFGTDIYGRYVADVFYRKEGDKLKDRVGIHLNRELVVAGLAGLV